MKQSEIEQKVLEFWRQDGTFRKSVAKAAPQGDFVFYDGPPFATGAPHYGHIVASLMKDMVPRYWTMRGWRVERRWGWDCHGLPIENIVEKEHNFKHKKDILAYGVEKFNEDARSKVLAYVKEWREVIDRLGRWVDMDNSAKGGPASGGDGGYPIGAYKTMDWEYMESIWWAFKQLYDKGLLYEAYRSMHICPRCETTLAQSEVAQGYKNVQDLSVVVKFKITKEALKKGSLLGSLSPVWSEDLPSNRDSSIHTDFVNSDNVVDKKSRSDGGHEGNRTPQGEMANPPSTPVAGPHHQDRQQELYHNVYMLAWTTTPWTLPGNAALAVGEDIKYVIVKLPCHPERSVLAESRDLFVVAKDRIKDIFKDTEFEIIKELKGKDLVGLEYEPLFPYYDNSKTENHQNAFKVYAAPFVSTEEGTGIVHVAPAFGEDDMNLGKSKNLPFIQHVNMDGTLDFHSVISSEAYSPSREISGIIHEIPRQARDDGSLESLNGLEVKPKGDPSSTDRKIAEYLDKKGFLFSQEEYSHPYPHCWRCESPLLNYAASSWFVNVAKIKDKLLKEAKSIYWMPEHIKEGRFGKWLEGARDWSISRQRFWGSVLPVWKSEDGKEIKVIGSIDELRAESGAKITKIIFVRHGESEKNITHTHSSALDKHPLTKTGEKEVQDLAKALSGEKIDAIISSPILRARETAERVAKKLGLEIEFDDRLLEDNNGQWEEKTQDDLDNDEAYQKYLSLPLTKRFAYKMGGGESGSDVEARVRDFINDLAKKHAGQTVVVVAHGIVSAAFDQILNKGSLEKFYYLCDYTPFAAPFGYYLNPDGSGFDLHKHYIDQITLKGKNGSALRRIPDVLDCWFESGSMPFAQSHYPFENKERFEQNFPAQFIAEGVDQPRTWFYYLHVLAVAIMGKPSFKNVIVNGIVLAEDGKKMSKRLQNYPDPMAIFNKYGADAVRYYLACSPVLRAEDLNFSEKGVEEVVKKVLLILYNVLSFYKLYSDPNDPNKHPNDANILDEWMIAKTWLLIDEVAIAYNSYDLNRAARPITGFINDLSTWYLRRSRDRFKGDDEKDKKAVLGTLRWTLEQLALVMSPVMPFTAEYVWQELGNKESVHLAKWPDKQKIKEVGHIMNRMDAAKIIVELGLAKRAEKGIKIRQPLQKIIVKGEELDKEYTQLIIDELNVKTVEFQKGDGEHVVVELDMAITPELKLEGHLRELVRTINGRRKKAGLTPGDVIAVTYQTDSEELRKVFVQYGEALKKAVIAGEIKSSENDGETMEINGEQIKISIQKYKLQVTSFKLQDREEFCGNLETGNL